MNNCNKETSLKTGLVDLHSGNKSRQGKLYVAYRNNALNDGGTSFMETINNQVINNNNRNTSVFSSTGGFYYIDGIPVLLSQDDEAVLYEGALSEYY